MKRIYNFKNNPYKKAGKNLIFKTLAIVILILAVLTISFVFVPGALKTVFAKEPRLTVNVVTPSPSQTALPTKTQKVQPTETQAPTPAPSEDPDAKYFSAAETVNVNSDNTEWTYSSQNLYIDIKKYDKNDLKLHYFVADIRTKNGEIFKSGFSDETHPGKNALLPYKVAEKLKAVFLLNGDFFEDIRNPSGIIIRHGKVCKDDTKADTLAIMPDGSLKVYSPGETNATELLNLGVQDTFSFGPTLIRDGIINPDLSKASLERANPRTGIGMIDKGHYIAIVVEGRNPKENRGVTLEEYAQMFADLGCTAAYNLDGGASSAMVFMGETLNIPTDILTTKTWRRVPDVLMIGTSDAVQVYK